MEREDTMDELFQALAQAYETYREELEKFERKRRPADGLFGFGHPLQQDGCHDRLDERVEKITGEMAALRPSAQEAERAVRILLFPEQGTWPLAAEWMLRAVERHALVLIPFLDSQAAASIGRTYAGRYRPWDRLPAQKQVLNALKSQA